MGGFEGGDEGGFWDEQSTYINAKKTPKLYTPNITFTNNTYSIKSYARLKIFSALIDVIDENYHIFSRYIRLNNIFDTISFVPSECHDFSIEGCTSIALEDNSIYKVYHALLNFTDDDDIKEFFQNHKVVVEKTISSKMGLSASVSNAVAFLHLCKEACSLVLTEDEILHICNVLKQPLVKFFVYHYPAANVISIHQKSTDDMTATYTHESIELFNEETLNIELHPLNIPNVKKDNAILNTAAPSKKYTTIDSRTLLRKYSSQNILNDLQSESKHKDGWYCTETTFFKIDND